LFFSPDFFVPMVNAEQIDAGSFLNARGTRWVFELLGHLKPGVTPTQASADLSSIGSYLTKAYPKDDDQPSFSLVRPGLHGNFFAPAIRAFLTGVDAVGRIDSAGCVCKPGQPVCGARCGSIAGGGAAAGAGFEPLPDFAATCSSKLFLISLAGGAAGLWGGVMVLHWLSGWKPFPEFPMNIPVNPDANVYLVALLLALISGLLFGAVPVRQVLRTNPYEIVKAGSTARMGRGIAFATFLLVVQIAICAVLVTSSMVAMRGLAHSLHANLGFDPQNTCWWIPIYGWAWLSRREIPAIQKRMSDTIQDDSRRKRRRIGPMFLRLHMGWSIRMFFSDQTTDFRPSNAAATVIRYKVSAEYFRAARAALRTGRIFSNDDDMKSPVLPW